MNEDQYRDLSATCLMLRATLAALIARVGANCPDSRFIDHVRTDAMDAIDQFVDRDARLWRESRDLMEDLIGAARQMADGPVQE